MNEEQKTKLQNGANIIFYDGVCGLCNSFVQFVLRYSNEAKFLFCTLQSNLAGELLAKYGENNKDLNTVFVLTNYNLPTSQLLKKARAVLFVLHQCKEPWCWLSIFRILPDFILNLSYDFIANIRYKIFGKYESCMIPNKEVQNKFIDI